MHRLAKLKGSYCLVETCLPQYVQSGINNPGPTAVHQINSDQPQWRKSISHRNHPRTLDTHILQEGNHIDGVYRILYRERTIIEHIFAKPGPFLVLCWLAYRHDLVCDLHLHPYLDGSNRVVSSCQGSHNFACFDASIPPSANRSR